MHNTEFLESYNRTRTALLRKKLQQLRSPAYIDLRDNGCQSTYAIEHGTLNLDFGRQTGKSYWMASLGLDDPFLALFHEILDRSHYLELRKPIQKDMCMYKELEKHLKTCTKPVMMVSNHAYMAPGELNKAIKWFMNKPTSDLVVLI